MLFETPQDTYNAYERFLKKNEYKKAYRCLEKMLKQFPYDEPLLEDIINLAFLNIQSYKLSKKWLSQITDIRQVWRDYAMLAECEVRLGDIKNAKKYYQAAVRLEKKQKWLTLTHVDSKSALQGLKERIKIVESGPLLKNNKKEEKIKKTVPKKDISKSKRHENKKPVIQQEEAKQAETKKPDKKTKKVNYSIPIKFSPFTTESVKKFQELEISTLDDCKLWINYNHLVIQRSFDELLCLNEIDGIEKFWYQIETVKKVLKSFKGRVLLADEVGMGKTIETGMLIKEYLMRGMIKSVLILTPASLVSQWKEEMITKFAVDFNTTDNALLKENPDKFWDNKFIIASINTAKSVRHFKTVSEHFFDLVVVDEAHHLKNRKTIAWKLVNQLRKRFIFLLSATPVQNNLIELYNLITLLKPGQFQTEKIFKKEYVKRGNPRMPVNKEKLQELIRDVMIRNTRSLVDMKLPKRFASTIMVEPSEGERGIYENINSWAREWFVKGSINKMLLNTLLRQAGSSMSAVRSTLMKIKNNGYDKGIDSIIHQIDSLSMVSKGAALIDIISKNPLEKKVIFTQYLKTMDSITSLLDNYKLPYVKFNGSMSSRQKDEAIRKFQEETPVLITTEVGGEGRNMQFCNTMINYDLPWNPMKIEQRIGRLYRIGQKRDVFIFNLALKNSIESYILQILDSKINMFEMVIGEVEPILGYYAEDKDFDDIVIDLWIKNRTDEELKKSFAMVGEEMVAAKEAYIKTKALDAQIFGEEFEV